MMHKTLTSGSWIEGLRVHRLDSNPDDRGAFTELFCDTWDSGIRPRQWSLVNSRPRVLRGMHLHLEHDEYISVIHGRACIGLYDLRPESGTYREHVLIECDASNPAFVTFPRGVLHGWYFHETSVHIQATSDTFADYGSHDNWGCYFGDSALGIPWPDPAPVLSERAAFFPRLHQLEELIASYRNPEVSTEDSVEEIRQYADTAVTKVRD